MSTLRVPLRSRNYPGLFAIIDEQDAERVLAHEWHTYRGRRGFYARMHIPGVQDRITMHRFLMDDPAGMEVDHRDGDGLNNRRGNLRLATRQQNAQNIGLRACSKSGYKGVSLNAASGKYVAVITLNKKLTWLGSYDRPEDAARAYDTHARIHFGEFGRYNFPEEGERGVRDAS